MELIRWPRPLAWLRTEKVLNPSLLKKSRSAGRESVGRGPRQVGEGSHLLDMGRRDLGRDAGEGSGDLFRPDGLADLVGPRVLEGFFHVLCVVIELSERPPPLTARPRRSRHHRRRCAHRSRVGDRPSPNPDRTGDTLVGRCIAYAQRSGAVVAIVAEVEVDRHTGKVWARKFTAAHDCGLIINPDGLRRRIEGNFVQGTSRAVSQEVTFDRTKATSVDWTSYPILDTTEAPETVDIVLINRPELSPVGAGESSIRPIAAALANAVFDATGVCLRGVHDPGVIPSVSSINDHRRVGKNLGTECTVLDQRDCGSEVHRHAADRKHFSPFQHLTAESRTLNRRT